MLIRNRDTFFWLYPLIRTPVVLLVILGRAGWNGYQALLGIPGVPLVTRGARWLLHCRFANSLRRGLTDRPPSPFANNRALDCRSVATEPRSVSMGALMSKVADTLAFKTNGGVGPGQITDIGARAPMSDKGGGSGRLLSSRRPPPLHQL